MKFNFKRLSAAIIALLIVLSVMLAGCGDRAPEFDGSGFNNATKNTVGKTQNADQNNGTSQEDPICKQLGIPSFSGNGFASLNNGVPKFTDEEITDKGYEFYSELDKLGRCGYAMACVGTETLPSGERGNISSVKPTGWIQNKYDTDVVSGGSLYNRSHLIAWSLTGEDANERNLITGTEYMNQRIMTQFEDMVRDAVKEDGLHVMYRVTPMFYENELVARGVIMEAYSVEDKGETVSFNVYVYNVQPGIVIDYATGNNWLATETGNNVAADEDNKNNDAGNTEGQGSYVLNTYGKKVHIPTCPSVEQMNPANKQEYTGALADILSQGYTKCGTCHAGEAS